MLVARVWRRAGLQPHRLEGYMLSDDPDVEQKAADVLGLSLNPPGLSAHQTKTVETFLTSHPRVHLQLTPTYSSWLNQVELWFNKIERDLLARGIFTSAPDLARKIRRDITTFNERPKPIRWTYNDPSHRTTVE